MSDYGIWRRNRARNDLELLERMLADLDDYASRHNLSTETPPWPGTTGRTVWASDRTDPRSTGSVEALQWLQDEVKWTRAQLAVFEKEESPDVEQPVTLASLRGIAPDLTNGLPSEEYVRNLRTE